MALNVKVRDVLPLIVGGGFLIVAFLAFGMHYGVPVLRHDWGLPTSPDGWRAFAVSTTSGWDTNGIGAPRPYPTLFILGPVLSAVALALGSTTAVETFLAAIAAANVIAGIRIANAYTRKPWLGLTLSAALLYNPWVYEKLVAGHLTMLLSVGMCGILASELLRERPRRWLLVTCAYVAAFQIQFGILVVIFAALVRFDRRTIMLVLSGSILSLLPSIIGIALSQSSLLRIPFTVAWQLSNSVPLPDAALLDGYAPHYTRGAEPMLRAGGALLLVAVAIGIWHGIRNRASRARTLRMTLGAATLICYATGLSSIFAGLYSLTLNVRQTLVFRELFDLLGIVALLYGLIAVAGSARSRLTHLALLLAACTMFIGWCVSPPWHWWVPGKAVPHVRVDTRVPNVRFALMPWRQPLQFEGRGSGADPDVFARANNVTPLNEYEEQYPIDVALAAYARAKDGRGLEALSVGRVYARDYFKTDIATLSVAVPTDRFTFRSAPGKVLHPLPELMLMSTPPIVDRLEPFPDLYLLDGGHPTEVAKDIEIVNAPNVVTDPSLGWVSIPIVATDYTAVANAIGGAFTTSPEARLAVPRTRPEKALAFIKGRLTSNIGTLSGATQGWRWILLSNSKWLSCRGACAVVAWQRRPFSAPQKAGFIPTAVDERVVFHELAPFLIVGKLRPSVGNVAPRMLLYRTRYDSAWKLLGVPGVQHVQVSTLFNGYEMPNNYQGGRFIVVEVTAIVQALAMLVSIVGIVLLSLARPTERST